MESMANGLYQGQEQRQEMTLTPRQMQSLEILAAPTLELQQKIAVELAENPILETELPEPELPESTPDVGSEQIGCEKDDREEELARIVELAASGASLSGREEDFSAPDESGSDADERREYFFNSIADHKSMQEQLLEQLAFSDADASLKKNAETVIGSIDNSGYCRTHAADIATGCGCPLEEAEKAIRLVQTFDPPGIGARTLEECLTLQLERSGCTDEIFYRLVAEHLEDIASNRLPKAAKELGITLEELNEKIGELRKLDPRPGRELAQETASYVEPDVFVVPEGDEFKVVSNGDSVPRLRISRNYLKMLEDPATDPETRAWLKNRLTSGNGLLRALEQRESTIVRIAKIIVSAQYDFLREGVEHMKPMTMRQIADRVGLHETTVSRAIAGKYMKTPVGLFEFRYFFTAGFRSGEGEDVSSRGVKEILRKLVDAESPAAPLSDSALTAKLKEKGLPVARRTVAKYREELGIPASHLRKKY